MNKPIRIFILRSITATAIGWLIPPAIIFSISWFSIPINVIDSSFLDRVQAFIGGYLIQVIIIGFWVIPSWLVLILPLALYVPNESKFWHPLVIAPVGLIAGGVVLMASLAILATGPGVFAVKSSLPLAGIASAIGVLTALSLSYFTRRTKPVSDQKPNSP